MDAEQILANKATLYHGVALNGRLSDYERLVAALDSLGAYEDHRDYWKARCRAVESHLDQLKVALMEGMELLTESMEHIKTLEKELAIRTGVVN